MAHLRQLNPSELASLLGNGAMNVNMSGLPGAGLGLQGLQGLPAHLQQTASSQGLSLDSSALYAAAVAGKLVKIIFEIVVVENIFREKFRPKLSARGFSDGPVGAEAISADSLSESSLLQQQQLQQLQVLQLRKWKFPQNEFQQLQLAQQSQLGSLGGADALQHLQQLQQQLQQQQQLLLLQQQWVSHVDFARSILKA
eukprot:758857-Hanusia_phi.AAC.5